MAIVLLLLVALVSLVLPYLLLQRGRRERAGSNKHLKLPPGPKQLPLIGNLHQLGELPHQALWQLSKIHGPVIFLKLGTIPTVFVSSVAAARDVLKARDLDFCSRPSLVATDKIFYNQMDIGFAPYGDYWRQMRKLCMVELLSTRRVQSFQDMRREEVALMIKAIASKSSSSSPIDVRSFALNLANNIVCQVAFSARYPDESLQEKGEVDQILREMQNMLAAFYFGDYFPWLSWIDTLVGSISKLDNLVKKLDSFYQNLIQEHLDHSRIRPDDHHEDIVHILLRLTKENANLSHVNVKSIINDLFFAGTETISSTIVWAMTELAKKPGLRIKVQEEVRREVGPKGMVEERDLSNLHLLKAVIKETLRLHNAAPLLLPRESMRQSKILEYDIPPNSRVYVNAWGIARDPQEWDNPEEFNPDRFMNNPFDFQGHDLRYIPFGSGRRICPAVNFSEPILQLALANLLYSFDWKLPDAMKEEDINMDETPGINAVKRTPLYLVPANYIS